MSPTIQTSVDELLARWPSAAMIFGRHGMACVGCSMARFETVGEAAAAYGLDAQDLLRELVRGIRKKEL